VPFGKRPFLIRDVQVTTMRSMTALGLGRVKTLWRTPESLLPPPLQIGPFVPLILICFVVSERSWRAVLPFRASW
jgi:hypothetical protein